MCCWTALTKVQSLSLSLFSLSLSLSFFLSLAEVSRKLSCRRWAVISAFKYRKKTIASLFLIFDWTNLCTSWLFLDTLTLICPGDCARSPTWLPLLVDCWVFHSRLLNVFVVNWPKVSPFSWYIQSVSLKVTYFNFICLSCYKRYRNDNLTTWFHLHKKAIPQDRGSSHPLCSKNRVQWDRVHKQVHTKTTCTCLTCASQKKSVSGAVSLPILSDHDEPPPTTGNHPCLTNSGQKTYFLVHLSAWIHQAATRVTTRRDYVLVVGDEYQ